jgi:hypothetical protein
MSRVALAFVALSVVSCSKSESKRGQPEQPRESAATTQPATAAPDDSAEQDDGRWLAEEAASLMADAMRSVALEVKLKGASLAVADKRIAVKAKVNDRVQREGQHILAVEFSVSIDGRPVPAFHVGAIGIDPSPDGARQTAVSEWAGQYGAPIAFAISARLGATQPPAEKEGMAAFYSKLEVAGEVFYHGPPGLRGTVKDTAAVSSPDLVGNIAKAVLASMAGNGQFRSATVMLVVEGARVTGGECRVNGEVSPALLAKLRAISWPEGDPKYMYKQFLVVAGRP